MTTAPFSRELKLRDPNGRWVSRLKPESIVNSRRVLAKALCDAEKGHDTFTEQSHWLQRADDVTRNLAALGWMVIRMENKI
jgi:hypothetical protein